MHGNLVEGKYAEADAVQDDSVNGTQKRGSHSRASSQSVPLGLHVPRDGYAGPEQVARSHGLPVQKLRRQCHQLTTCLV